MDAFWPVEGEFMGSWLHLTDGLTILPRLRLPSDLVEPVEDRDDAIALALGRDVTDRENHEESLNLSE